MEGNDDLWLRRNETNARTEMASFRGRLHVVVEDRTEYKLYRVRVHK